MFWCWSSSRPSGHSEAKAETDSSRICRCHPVLHLTKNCPIKTGGNLCSVILSARASAQRKTGLPARAAALLFVMVTEYMYQAVSPFIVCIGSTSFQMNSAWNCPFAVHRNHVPFKTLRIAFKISVPSGTLRRFTPESASAWEARPFK